MKINLPSIQETLKFSWSAHGPWCLKAILPTGGTGHVRKEEYIRSLRIKAMYLQIGRTPKRKTGNSTEFCWYLAEENKLKKSNESTTAAWRLTAVNKQAKQEIVWNGKVICHLLSTVQMAAAATTNARGKLTACQTLLCPEMPCMVYVGQYSWGSAIKHFTTFLSPCLRASSWMNNRHKRIGRAGWLQHWGKM